MKVSFGEVMSGRQLIADFVSSMKSRRLFSVIDVGGSAVGWSLPLSDAFIDINECNTNKLQFKIDICRERSWVDVLKFVETNGKFDYCICTHTLEDIYNPYIVLDYMPKIARSGIITMPSIKTEVNLVENSNWRGFAHHRYLFGHRDKKIVIAPKLPVVEKLNFQDVLRQVEEIRFEWDDDIEYEVFMNNYLGPNTDIVLMNYERFIREQI